MTDRHTGACHCRAIQFSYSGEPRFVADCVCESCRRAHGATAVSWTGVEDGQFQIDAGKAQLAWYQSSEQSHRGFCKNCGTRFLFRSAKWPGETHMSTACLDSSDTLRSKGVSFKEELPGWTTLKLDQV